MARSSSVFVCQSCGYSQSKWAGKCPNCGEWNSLVETLVEGKVSAGRTNARSAKTTTLSSLESRKVARIQTGISEFDRVLGGGLVSGHVVLLAGEPGIGKSTMLLQVAEKIGLGQKDTGKSVVYVAGEESPIQIKLRAERLGLTGAQIEILEETNVDTVLASIDNPSLVIVDSIQTLSTSDLVGVPGSVGQVRECAHRLTRFAKSSQTPIILVGQITKGGSVAGPATLAHMVDTVCWFEGEPERDLRILRTIKNRFGATDEIGVFRMEEHGLASVTDIESAFLLNQENAPGAAVTSILEGSRPLIAEVQSLVVPSKLPIPRRVASGVDAKRVDVILAVLTKHARLPVYDHDVFVNAVGGITIKEPGSDLAIALSLASSVKGKKLPDKSIAIGEVGLLGEIRPVLRQEERIKQAKRQGFKNIITNKTSGTLSQLIKEFF